MSGPRLLAKAAGMLVAKTQFQRDLHRLNPYPALKDGRDYSGQIDDPFDALALDAAGLDQGISQRLNG
jgi:hypothetical protein